MAPVGVRFADGDIRLGGTADKRLQDRGDGVSDLMDGRGTGRQSLYLEDDGRGEEL